MELNLAEDRTKSEERPVAKPKKVKRSLKEKILITILLVVTVVGLSVLAYKMIDFRIYMDGQLVLGQARVIRIALENQKYQYYAEDKTIGDQTTASGLKPNVLRDIQELYNYKGELRVTQCSKDGLSAVQLFYTEGNYTAVYNANAEDGNYWDVYFHWRTD